MRFLLVLVLLLAGCATAQSLGRASLDRGDLKGAERQLTQSIRQGDTSAWNDLGVTYHRQGRIQEAIDAFNMGARYGDPTARANLARNKLPIPPADLASAPRSSSDGVAEAIDGFNRGYSGGINCATFGSSDLRMTNCR